MLLKIRICKELSIMPQKHRYSYTFFFPLEQHHWRHIFIFIILILILIYYPYLIPSLPSSDQLVGLLASWVAHNLNNWSLGHLAVLPNIIDTNA